MRLDDLDVVAGAEDAGRRPGELVGRVDADREVGRHDDGNALRLFGDQPLLRIGEPGGADDHRLGAREVCERAFRARKVDHHVGLPGRGRIGQDFAIAGALADGRAALEVKRGGERELGVRQHRLDQRAAHAAAGAGDRHSHRGSPDAAMSPSTRASRPSSKYTANLRCSRSPAGVSRQ